MISYKHKEIEKKWQETWEKEKLYTPDIKNTSKKDKFYNLLFCITWDNNLSYKSFKKARDKEGKGRRSYKGT